MTELVAYYVTQGKQLAIIEKTLPAFYLAGLADGVKLFLIYDGEEKNKKIILNLLPKDITFLQTPQPYSGVCAARNLGIQTSLSNLKSKVIFFIDETAFVIPSMRAFQIYAATIDQTGIQHFNAIAPHYCQRVFRFLTPDAIDLSLYTAYTDYFSVYTRDCLETVGLFDESYKDDTFEYTYRCGVKGFTTPWNWFVDLTQSTNFIRQFPGNSLKKTNQQQFTVAQDQIVTDLNQIRTLLADFYTKRKTL